MQHIQSAYVDSCVVWTSIPSSWPRKAGPNCGFQRTATKNPALERLETNLQLAKDFSWLGQRWFDSFKWIVNLVDQWMPWTEIWPFMQIPIKHIRNPCLCSNPDSRAQLKPKTHPQWQQCNAHTHTHPCTDTDKRAQARTAANSFQSKDLWGRGFMICICDVCAICAIWSKVCPYNPK